MVPTPQGQWEIDPTANGNIFRYTFGIQTLLNVFGGGHMILFAEHSLSQLVSEPSDMNPAALATMQQCGALMFAFNTPPVLAIPNIRRAIDSRGSVYYLLDSGGSEFSPDPMLYTCCILLPPFLWRLYVLFRKPHWLGRYRESRKEN
ncbi:hypothetical protein K432DRAFT_414796 [Lepidopterella palustris CBS 459.81]|uniref:Uncharacterized protein n=1 Tax=Lepidopterella palustris CBS 459.81 TaxID=1314670 RepID=A0A8E2EFV9_9PEZI|nr:hypothetical protein K432DRAFT_414796 [Lepidopterella palustris CBS 459.81]